MRKYLGLTSAMAAFAASLGSDAQPIKTAPYTPAGVRKPTFTEKRKAEAAARRARKKGR